MTSLNSSPAQVTVARSRSTLALGMALHGLVPSRARSRSRAQFAAPIRDAFQSAATPSSRRRPRSTGSRGLLIQPGGLAVAGSRPPRLARAGLSFLSSRWGDAAARHEVDRDGVCKGPGQGSGDAGMGGHNDVGNNRTIKAHRRAPRGRPRVRPGRVRVRPADYRRHRVGWAGEPWPGNQACARARSGLGQGEEAVVTYHPIHGDRSGSPRCAARSRTSR